MYVVCTYVRSMYIVCTCIHIILRAVDANDARSQMLRRYLGTNERTNYCTQPLQRFENIFPSRHKKW